MAWRFRWSTKVGLFRLNLSKSGVGFSFGVKGARIGKAAEGRTYTSATIPGTGLYRRDYVGKSRRGKARLRISQAEDEVKVYHYAPRRLAIRSRAARSRGCG